MIMLNMVGQFICALIIIGFIGFAAYIFMPAMVPEFNASTFSDKSQNHYKSEEELNSSNNRTSEDHERFLMDQAFAVQQQEQHHKHDQLS